MFHFWSSGLTIIVFLVTGIDRGDDVPVDMLTRIYERISRQELKTGADHTTQVRKVEETMVGKLPVSSQATYSLYGPKILGFFFLTAHTHNDHSKRSDHKRLLFIKGSLSAISPHKVHISAKICIYTYVSQAKSDVPASRFFNFAKFIYI